VQKNEQHDRINRRRYVQRALEDPGGIGAEREDRESTPPDGARSGQGSPPAPFFCFTKPMTADSTETDEKPCPLTVSEWIALLTAESQAKFGYKHLVVAILLAVCSIVLSGYVAGMTYITARFGSSGDYMQVIFGVAFAVLVYYAYRTKPTLHILMDMFKEKDKNSEIIKGIISGELTDSDEIRRRYHEQKNTHRSVRETDHRHPRETGQ